MSLRRPYEVVAKVESSAGGKAGAVGATEQDFIYPDKDLKSQDADIRIPIDSDDDTDGSIFISTDTSQKLEISQIVTRTDYKARGGDN